MRFRRAKIAKLSDDQLVWLYSDTRKKEYLGELCTRYLPLVYGLCLKYHPVREQAKGAARQFYEKLPEQLIADTEIIGEFRDWLFERAESFLNARPSAGRPEGVEASRVLDYAGIEFLDKLRAGDDNARKALEQHSAALTKPQKECLRLFLDENKSFADIAEQTGYLTDNVNMHIVKGLESVASALTGKVKKTAK